MLKQLHFPCNASYENHLDLSKMWEKRFQILGDLATYKFNLVNHKIQNFEKVFSESYILLLLLTNIFHTRAKIIQMPVDFQILLKNRD